MHTRSRFNSLVAMFIVAASVLTGCGQSQEYGEVDPRPVTEEEAERLAVMRFNNYNRQAAEVSVSYTEAETSMWLEGRVDFTEDVGYGNLLVSDETSTNALVQWSGESLTAVGMTTQELPLQPPTEAPWEQRSLDTSASTLDTTLALVLETASDRPENPLLLQQNGAQWLGKEEIDGTEMDVFSAPGHNNAPTDTLLYYLDDGGTLHRVVVNFPDARTAATINFLGWDAEGIDPVSTNDT